MRSARARIAIAVVAAIVAGCSKGGKSSKEIDLVPGEPEHAAAAAPLGGGGNETGRATDPNVSSISTSKPVVRNKRPAAQHRDVPPARASRSSSEKTAVAKKRAGTPAPGGAHQDYAVNPK